MEHCPHPGLLLIGELRQAVRPAGLDLPLASHSLMLSGSLLEAFSAISGIRMLTFQSRSQCPAEAEM